MNGNTNKIRRRLAAIVLGAAAAAVGAPAAQAGDRIVDDWFRDAPAIAAPSQTSDQIVDDWFRDAPAIAALYQPGDRIVDDSFRDSPSALAVVTPRQKRLDGDSMFRDYLRGTQWTSQPQSMSNLNYLYRRSVALNDLHHGGQTMPVGSGSQVSTDKGFDFGNLQLGLVVAACGLLLLAALGIGARQVRHTRHRLGSA